MIRIVVSVLTLLALSTTADAQRRGGGYRSPPAPRYGSHAAMGPRATAVPRSMPAPRFTRPSMPRNYHQPTMGRQQMRPPMPRFRQQPAYGYGHVNGGLRQPSMSPTIQRRTMRPPQQYYNHQLIPPRQAQGAYAGNGWGGGQQRTMTPPPQYNQQRPMQPPGWNGAQPGYYGNNQPVIRRPQPGQGAIPVTRSAPPTNNGWQQPAYANPTGNAYGYGGGHTGYVNPQYRGTGNGGPGWQQANEALASTRAEQRLVQQQYAQQQYDMSVTSNAVGASRGVLEEANLYRQGLRNEFGIDTPTPPAPPGPDASAQDWRAYRQTVDAYRWKAYSTKFRLEVNRDSARGMMDDLQTQQRSLQRQQDQLYYDYQNPYGAYAF